MSNMLKIFAASVYLSAAADCSSRPELCTTGFDETNLLQITSELVLQKTTNQSDVEVAQNAIKAAASNTSIQKYAASVTRMNSAKMRQIALQKQNVAMGKHEAKVKAVRAAAAAVQAAQDEAFAWQTASEAEKEANALSSVAEADKAAKHAIRRNATLNLTAAQRNLTLAESNLKRTKITQQQRVNEASAEAHAEFAVQTKIAARKATAEQKAAAQKAKALAKQEQLAQKASWRSWRKSVNDEWAAAHQSSKTQFAAEKAGASNVLENLQKQQAASLEATG
jgi:hypothetical protein